jgi:lysozyme family protein
LGALDVAFPTPRDCLRGAIQRWEGEWQSNRNDNANYAHCRDGSVKLIGTMRGVTPAVYAQYKGVDPCSLTPDQMQKEITLDVAAEIGIDLFYARPGFSHLTWSPVVEIAVDIGWGSGPARGVKMLQQQTGAPVDGLVGPQTGAALDQYLETHDIESACEALTNARVQYYLDISPPGSKAAGFRAGWLKRANWYRPANADWWSQWTGWTMPLPAGSSKPLGLLS